MIETSESLASFVGNRLEMQAQAEYVHQELDREITAIGGYYVLVKEVRLPFRGQEILYLVGHAAFETTCCGTGGCAYGLVPGFILDWKGRVDKDGLFVSRVEPIRDKSIQEQVRKAIEKREMVHQFRFL
jgi:hypothetical protein